MRLWGWVMSEFLELIEQDARITKATTPLPAGPLGPKLCKRYREELERYLSEHSIDAAALAKALGEPGVVVKKFLAGDASITVDTRDRLLRKGMAWVELECRSRAMRRELPDSFVETAVAKRLMGASRRLVERLDIGVAYGPAGIGKSLAIKAVAAELPNVIALTITDDTRLRIGFLTAAFNAIQNTQRKQSPRARLHDVVGALRQAASVAARPLLIIDQAHRLHSETLQIVADIFDEAEASILLVGTVDIYRRVSDDEDVHYGQLSSRIGLRVNLAPEVVGRSGPTRRKLITVDEIRRIFQTGKVRLHSSAAELLSDIASNAIGHLRRAARLVAWAVAVAKKRGGVSDKDGAIAITAEDVVQGARIVEGDDRARSITAAAPRSSMAGAG